MVERINPIDDPDDLGREMAKLIGDENGRFFDPTKRNLLTENERHNFVSNLGRQLGPKYAICTFENYETTEGDGGAHEAKNKVVDFCCCMPNTLKNGGGITLYGNPGTGKDHLLSAAMFYAIIAYGLRVKWVNGLDLYWEMRSRIADNDSEKEVIVELTEPHILCISDPIPPRGEATRYNTETLFRILDRRYRDNKSTWCSMNATSGEDASDRMAANIVDRLRHNSLTIKCDWPSYRKSHWITDRKETKT